MFKTKYILLWSQDPDKLVKFYTDTLGLDLIEKTDIPAKDGLEKDYGYNLNLSENNVLWIGHHSEVKGKNKDPYRFMVNLNTDEVQKWYEKVKEAGCEIIQEPILTPFATKENPVYVCTWLDPEGNCWQFMGKKVSSSRTCYGISCEQSEDIRLNMGLLLAMPSGNCVSPLTLTLTKTLTWFSF